MLCYPNDQYRGTGIAVHEFAHSFHERGLQTLYPDLFQRTRAAYRNRDPNIFPDENYCKPHARLHTSSTTRLPPRLPTADALSSRHPPHPTSTLSHHRLLPQDPLTPYVRIEPLTASQNEKEFFAQLSMMWFNCGSSQENIVDRATLKQRLPELWSP